MEIKSLRILKAHHGYSANILRLARQFGSRKGARTLYRRGVFT